MNLKKNFAIIILSVLLICLLTVNVNAVESALTSEFSTEGGEVSSSFTNGNISSTSSDITFKNPKFSASEWPEESLVECGVEKGWSACSFTISGIIYNGTEMSTMMSPLSVNGEHEITLSVKIPSNWIEVKPFIVRGGNGEQVSPEISNGKMTFSFKLDSMITYIPGGDIYFLAKGDGAEVKPEEPSDTPIVDEVEIKPEESTNTSITISGSEILSESVFAEAKELGKPVTINTGNGVTWEFSSIKDGTIGLNPNVTVSNTKLEGIKNKEITNGLFIDFSHSGELPGKAKVTVEVGTEKYGTGSKTLNVYYYNSTTKEYEYVGKATYNNGIVTFEITHCSTYVLTEQKLDSLDKEPKTGEISLISVGLIALISLGIAVIVKK